MLSLKEHLTELLINNKLLTQEQLLEAIELQKQKGGKLSDCIVSLKFAKESDLASVLSQGLGLPLIDLKRFKTDSEIVKIIPAEIARHYQILPVSKMGSTITLAMADPLNIFAIDYVKNLTGYKINPIISTVQDIMQAIETYYPDSTKDMLDDIVKEISDTPLEFIKEEKTSLPNDKELTVMIHQAPVIKITNMILEEGVKRKTSDILIEPMDKKVRIRLRIDGVLYEHSQLPKDMLASVISRIKVMSDLNIAEHRLPQDGRFKINLAHKEVDFRISILPASLGEKAAIRILDKSTNVLDIDRLGFSLDALDKLKKAAIMPHGMILVCGPTGSGKTTTLYSLLKLIDSAEKNIVTVEDPVEYQLEGINQVSVNPDIGLTFSSALRSILRQDPNVIMIGEIRDYDTVDIAIKSALTGHLVFSTLHTTTACGALVRLINMGVEPYLINASLNCVAAQRLLRKVCDSCKESYLVSRDILERLNLDFELHEKSNKLTFYKGKGCPRCANTGYSGRIAIAEVLLLSQQIRELILAREQEHVIKKEARKEGLRTLREEGLEIAMKGLTTIEEVIRVTAGD